MYHPEQVIRELRALGFDLYVEAGVVHGRMRQGRVPLEARPWINALQMVNEECARLLENEPVKTAVIHGTEGLDVWKRRMEAGEIELAEPVRVSMKDKLSIVRYREVKSV